jgi:hypothetical protein
MDGWLGRNLEGVTFSLRWRGEGGVTGRAMDGGAGFENNFRRVDNPAGIRDLTFSTSG